MVVAQPCGWQFDVVVYLLHVCLFPQEFGVHRKKMSGRAGREQVMAKGQVACSEGSRSVELQTLELKCKIVKCLSWSVALVQFLVTLRHSGCFTWEF